MERQSSRNENEPSVKRYTGLKNQGATCYLNTVLQILFMTEDFRNAVQRAKKNNCISGINNHIAQLFECLMSGEGNTATTEGITAELKINVHKQEDAVDYLQKILNMVDPEMSKIFQGKMEHITICKKGHNLIKQVDPFFIIPISIESQSPINLQSCFESYFKPISMCGEDKINCKECQTMMDSETRTNMLEFPSVLVLHVERFDFYTMDCMKNDSPVEIPLKLLLKDCMYDLYAITNHVGSLSSGHYYADIKSFEDQQWYQFNDDTVWKMPNLVDSACNETAYLIFYRKCGSPGYCGLENQGSTCYLNAVLQTLFMTKEFRQHVTSLDRDGVSSDGNLAEELNKLFNKLETQQNKAVSTTGITKSLGITDVHKQRDAAELLHLILNKTPGSSRLFRGAIKTTRTCRSCKDKPRQIFEDFFSLTIPHQKSLDLDDPIQTCVDQMYRECQQYSAHCGKMRDMETKREISSFPKHLIVELRSEVTNSTSSYSKNDLHVIIRPHIKVFCHEYELYAVVNYSKRLDGVRCYNVDIKCEDEIWRRFEDSNVSESSLNDVFRKESSTHGSSEACLLMYKHREQTAGDTGEDQRNKKQRSMMASEVTQQQRDAAGKIQKTQKPREDHSQSHSVNIDSSDNKIRYCGLENQGSTCYLNAVLQTLFMTKEFRQHVTSLDRDGVSSDGNLAEELNKLFNKLETQQNKAVSTTGITKSLGITDVHKQRDAAELLHLILEKTPGSSELFKGTMKTTKTCRSSKDNPQETLEDFLSLTVSFGNSQDGKSEMTKFPKHLIVVLKRSETTNSRFGSSSSKNDLHGIICPYIKVFCHEYELYAVVNYNKRLDGAGRYNADIKCEDEIWRRFEDSKVLRSPLNSDFRQESSTHRSSEACLLVYKHREQNMSRSVSQDKGEECAPQAINHSPSHPGLIREVLEAVHEVTYEEAEDALRLNKWDFTRAVQQLKVDQLYHAGLGSQEKCKHILILFNWDLERASSEDTENIQFSEV